MYGGLAVDYPSRGHRLKKSLEVRNLFRDVYSLSQLLCIITYIARQLLFRNRGYGWGRQLGVFIYGPGGSVVGSVPCGRRVEPHSSHHVGTLGKSFIRSCLYNGMWRPALLPCS